MGPTKARHAPSPINHPLFIFTPAGLHRLPVISRLSLVPSWNTSETHKEIGEMGSSMGMFAAVYRNRSQDAADRCHGGGPSPQNPARSAAPPELTTGHA